MTCAKTCTSCREYHWEMLFSIIGDMGAPIPMENILAKLENNINNKGSVIGIDLKITKENL